MESSFNAVELRELRGGGGGGGGQCASPTPASAAWKAAGRGFENASYQQDEEQTYQQGALASAACAPSTSVNTKVGHLV